MRSSCASAASCWSGFPRALAVDFSDLVGADDDRTRGAHGTSAPPSRSPGAARSSRGASPASGDSSTWGDWSVEGRGAGAAAVRGDNATSRRVRSAAGPWRAQCSGAWPCAPAHALAQTADRRCLRARTRAWRRSKATCPSMRCRGWRRRSLRADGALHLPYPRRTRCAGASRAPHCICGRTSCSQCQRCSNAIRYPLRREAHFRFVGSDEELDRHPDRATMRSTIIVGARSMDVAPGSKTRRSCPCRWCRATKVVGRCVAVGSRAESTSQQRTRPNPFAALAGLKPAAKPS